MRIVLKADEGFVYTNGEIYGTTIYLAEGVSAEGFRQITIEEYNRLMEQSAEGDIEGEATKEDCLEALAMLGVE